jgi:hypothetical protein
MKRIIAVSTLAIAACFGFSSAASAGLTDTSSHSGTVAATCSVTGTAGTLAATVTNQVTLGGTNFPAELVSTGGKFTTLCNTASSGIQVEKNVAPTVPTGQTAPTVTYDLSGLAGVYPAASFLTTGIGIDTVKTGTAVHSYSATPADLGVAVKVAAQSGKILQDGTYTVVLKATLTP